MKFMRAWWGALMAGCLLVKPAWASTETEQAAQAAFDEALKLMRLKRYAEACAHLARSQELDPAMGTQFRLAECYEKLGRFASAYDQYIEVAEAAKEGKQVQRESVARTRAAAIESKVARLTIDIAPSVASLAGVDIRRDGVVVPKSSWGQAVTIDTGDHVVTVSAPGKLPFERKFWADSSAKLVVSVAALDAKQAPKGPARSKIPAFIMGGVGVVGVGLGATFVVLRSGKIDEAEGLSKDIIGGGGNCRPGASAVFATPCQELLAAAKSGDQFGTLSIVSFSVGGAALLGMGAYLLWPEPKPSDQARAFRLTPMIGTNIAGLTASGVF